MDLNQLDRINQLEVDLEIKIKNFKPNKLLDQTFLLIN